MREEMSKEEKKVTRKEEKIDRDEKVENNGIQKEKAVSKSKETEIRQKDPTGMEEKEIDLSQGLSPANVTEKREIDVTDVSNNRIEDKGPDEAAEEKELARDSLRCVLVDLASNAIASQDDDYYDNESVMEDFSIATTSSYSARSCRIIFTKQFCSACNVVHDIKTVHFHEDENMTRTISIEDGNVLRPLPRRKTLLLAKVPLHREDTASLTTQLDLGEVNKTTQPVSSEETKQTDLEEEDDSDSDEEEGF